MSIGSNPLHSIKTFNQLVKYLRDELEWPIESDDFEELTFDYAPEELGLDAATAVKIKEVKQLRPLSNKQPWGIFFVNFAPKQLPVVALRRILSTLVIRKRQSANKAQQAAWRLHDLLFISSYGEAEHRDITFAHFAEEHGTGDLPTLRLLGWDDEDTKLKLDFVERELRTKLRWPDDENDIAEWRAKWSEAFRVRPREVIKTSQQLAIRLADLARGIRKRANNVLAVESNKGPLRKMHAAFKEALIHDLTTDDFADMYAQTIAYGLLTARVSRPAGLVAGNLSDMVPVTNPFLKDLLETFLTIGGRKGNIDFDELGINEVVQLLRDADMEAVLRDFGDRNPQEDPVIHFYELFLKEYDAKKRMQRGVFYTPMPVVSYIVRSMHELLQNKFGLLDGLADTTTWAEMVKRDESLVIPPGVSPDEPFVQVLDPATGTGTFLVEAIDVIRKSMEHRWKEQGHMALEFQSLWNDYVPKHLLPRLHGYELMMAPYAIAHMKIGLKLFETGYRFDTDTRARVYLTNALEPPVDDRKQSSFADFLPALAQEAKAVDTIKHHQRFTVVIGNPPYSGVSSNNSAYAVRLVDAYKIIDGERLQEKKLWLQDDYVKFLRFAQMTIDRAGVGIVGFITNHGYLDNPTFRGMRQSLLNSFQWRQAIDLHGNAKKKEIAPDGTTDENVFDIQQGVAIGIFARVGAAPSSDTTVRKGDLFGSRYSKYKSLSLSKLQTLASEQLRPTTPFYLFVGQDQTYRQEFEGMPLLSDITYEYSVGVVTARDHLTIAFSREEIWSRAQRFAELDEEDAREEFELRKDVRDWKVSLAQEDLRAQPLSKTLIRPILYRPFDTRFIYYTGRTKGFIGQPATAIMSQMIDRENLGLMTTRKVEVGTFGHAICSNTMTESHSVSLKEVNYLFPLWLYPSSNRLNLSAHRQPNITPQFLRALANSLGISRISETGMPEGISPEDIFHYAYAVFHSPRYRSRYAQFLKTDFPRLPLAGRMNLFTSLARFGSELVALHLLKSPRLDGLISYYIGPKNPEVEKISYAQHTVWINKEQSCGFKGVPEATWRFHVGGYQVCEKWLKDRKGRKLSKDDITHYSKIVVALSETIRLMKKIDEVIDQHGGWPDAFTGIQQATN